MSGILYIAATPIGNLDDISPRAIEAMKDADLILCEDTRTSKTLLRHYSVTTPVKSLHRHNETNQYPKIIEKLQGGSTVVIVSDAGTPLIRDAGRTLVSEAHRANIRVSPLPGACAVSAALSCCSFDGDRFVFEGFLPARRNERLNRLRELSTENRTLIFFEAPHRLLDTLADMRKNFGHDRNMCLSKELTKVHEATKHGTISEIIAWLNEDTLRCKGEFVILLEGAKSARSERVVVTADELLHILNAYLPPATAAKVTAKLSKIPRQKLYRRHKA